MQQDAHNLRGKRPWPLTGRLVMAQKRWSHGGAALHGKGARHCPHRPSLPRLLFLLSPRPHCRATPQGPSESQAAKQEPLKPLTSPRTRQQSGLGPGRAALRGVGLRAPGPPTQPRREPNTASPAGLPLPPEEPGAASASLLAGEPRGRSPAPQRLRGRMPFPPSLYWKGHEDTTNLHTPQPRKWYGLFPPV